MKFPLKPQLSLFLSLAGFSLLAIPAHSQSTSQSASESTSQAVTRWLEKMGFPPATFPSSDKGDADSPANSNGDDIYQDNSNSTGLTQDRAASGLREALSVSVVKAVTQTGRRDGFFRNELIKILMPRKLKSVERTLRAVGAGKQVDSFVLGMNRAAEEAAPQARNIFGDAIRGMSFSDVWGILRGGDTAATDYFRARTTPRLSAAFSPIVSRSMNDVGAARQYKTLMSRYGNLPFVGSSAVDINQYVVDESLKGLFTVVAQQERDIRRNPAARVTQILRDVFGGRF